jgi:Rad3-related DNA helicase
MALIPQCSVCEDNNNLDSFKGFYQERYGQRRLIRPDGALGQYAHHADASQAKKIHCASCHWSPPREKADLWASRYCWCWPDVPPQVQFDAKRVADGLEQFYRKNGSQMVRLTVPKSTLEYADYPQRLSSAVTALLKQSGKGRLYAYQAKALESLFENRVTVVQAPTGSGKSLIYQTFFLNGLVRNSSARMVALFPTQALTKDQARALVALTDREDDSPTIPALLTQSEYRVKALDRSFKLALFCGRDDDTHLNDATAQMLKRIKDTHVLMGTPDKLRKLSTRMRQWGS